VPPGGERSGRGRDRRAQAPRRGALYCRRSRSPSRPKKCRRRHHAPCRLGGFRSRHRQRLGPSSRAARRGRQRGSGKLFSGAWLRAHRERFSGRVEIVPLQAADRAAAKDHARPTRSRRSDSCGLAPIMIGQMRGKNASDLSCPRHDGRLLLVGCEPWPAFGGARHMLHYCRVLLANSLPCRFIWISFFAGPQQELPYDAKGAVSSTRH